MQSMYLIEMDIENRQRALERGAQRMRMQATLDVPPSPLRRAVASAIVRFGIFLNGRDYHCPDAPDTAMGAHPTG
jgi:hypothetical protein